MTMQFARIRVFEFRLPIHKHFGTIWAFYILEKLEYWFSHDKFHDKFYKFTEPSQSDHPAYRHGDSWTEELGISRKVFNKTFDLIGIRYASESAFKAEADPFKGKLYASYHNRQTHQTYYIRNHALVQSFLNSLRQTKDCKSEIKHKSSSITSYSVQPQPVIDQASTVKVDTRSTVEVDVLTSITNNVSTNHPRQSGDQLSQQYGEICEELSVCGNGPNGHSPTGPNGRSIYIQDNTNNLSSIHESHHGSQIPASCESHEGKEEDINKMLELWKRIVGHGYIPKLSQPLRQHLKTTLIELFDNCLDKWQAYCQKIASSKFLMGEQAGTRFKAWLTWAIKAETVQRVWQNGFSFGDRHVPMFSPSLEQSLQQTQSRIKHKSCPLERQFHHYLLARGGGAAYNNWLQHITCHVSDSGQINLTVYSRFKRDTIYNRFTPLLNQAIQHAFGEGQVYQLVCA